METENYHHKTADTMLDAINNENGKINKPLDITADEYAAQFHLKFSHRETLVLNEISQNPRVTMPKISETTGVCYRTVIRTIDRLRERGVLSRVGSRKAGSWQINAAPSCDNSQKQ